MNFTGCSNSYYKTIAINMQCGWNINTKICFDAYRCKIKHTPAPI